MKRVGIVDRVLGTSGGNSHYRRLRRRHYQPALAMISGESRKLDNAEPNDAPHQPLATSSRFPVLGVALYWLKRLLRF